MRTTIDINDALLVAAKSYAVHNQKTLEAVVEQALPIPVFSGRGVQPGVDLTDKAALEDLMNAES